MTQPTAPNALLSTTCDDVRGDTHPITDRTDDCPTFVNWSTNDWFFGNNNQYALIRYNVGLTRNNPGCDFNDTTSLPRCGDLLDGQPDRTTNGVSDVTPLDPPEQVDSPPQPRILYTVNEEIQTELLEPYTININEGDSVTLNAARSVSLNNAPLRYLWRQASGPTVLAEPTAGVEITVEVDGSLVPIDADNAQVVIWLEVRERDNRDLFRLEGIVLNVTKTNSQGRLTVNWLGDAVLNLTRIDDPDGGPFTDISHQWRQGSEGRFVDIEGATEPSYQVPAEARELQYRLVVSYIDRQLYTNIISSAAIPYSTVADVVDKDADGLIEISTIEELNAIRFQADGSGYRAQSARDGGTLNSSGCPGGTCSGYELTRDLDFGDADSYSTMNRVVIAELRDWIPIPEFDTTFEGNEFTISNLSVMIDDDGVGLFENAEGNAVIRNISLAEVTVRGESEVGALVGEFDGSVISNTHILSGNVVVTEDTGGCMIGSVGSATTISDSSANCTITGNATVGGLAGESSAVMRRSFAIGSIMEPQSNLNDTSNVGGLVGDNEGLIQDSYAVVDIRTQSVVDTPEFRGVGGLVGRNQSQGDIVSSYALGDVTIVGDVRTDFVGGLVGNTEGQIVSSYAVGDVNVPLATQSVSIGGLIGRVDGAMVDNSFATGNVEGYREVGGLIGSIGGPRVQRGFDSVVNNSYATGAVSGDAQIGGLVGNATLTGSISNSYAIGTISGQTEVGGLVGGSTRTITVLESYWDIEMSGQTISAAGTSRTTVQLQMPTAAGNTTGTVYYTWNETNWDFGAETQYPALKYADDAATTFSECGGESLFACGSLVRRQRLGLQSLQISQLGATRPVQIAPAFDATVIKEDPDAIAVRNYSINVDRDALEIGIAAVTNNVDGIISIADGPMSVGTIEYTPSLDLLATPLVNMLVSEPYEIEGTENLQVEYRLTFGALNEISDILYIAAIDEEFIPLDASIPVREGHFILVTTRISNTTGDDLSYEWSIDEEQVSLLDGSMLSGDVIGSSVGLRLRLNDAFIAADQSQATVNISLAVRDSLGVLTTRELSLPVMKHDNGMINEVSTPTQIGFTYIAPTITEMQLDEDIDNGGDVDSIGYRWQRQLAGVWSDIAGETERSFTVAGSIADFYRVIIGYTDGQGYRNEVPSAAARASAGLLLRAIPDAAVSNNVGRVRVDFIANNADDVDVLQQAEGDMEMGFDTRITNYTVPTEIDKVTVRAFGSEITINGEPLGQEIERDVALRFGDNVFTLQWQDEGEPVTYAVSILREYNTAIERWGISWFGQSEVDFTDPDTKIEPDTVYDFMQPEDFIPNDIETVIVSAQIFDAVDIAIELNGVNASVSTELASGGVVARASLPNLVLGENEIKFIVSSPGGLQGLVAPRSDTYTVNVWRRYNAVLEFLDTSSTEEKLVPAAIEPGRTQYEARTANHRELEQIEFRGAPGTTVTVVVIADGVERVSTVARASTSTVPLGIGVNTVGFTVQAPNEIITDYTLNIRRDYSLNLRSLSLADAVELEQAFTSTRSQYTATVSDMTTRVIVTFATDLEVDSALSAPTSPPITERVTIQQGNADDRIVLTALVLLNFGDNPIAMTLSALGEQRVTTLTVTRLLGRNANLQPQPDGLVVRPGAIRSYDEATRRFTIDVPSVAVPNVNADIELTLRPQDRNISRIILGNRDLDLRSLRDAGEVEGIISDLTEGEPPNEIALTLYAHDGMTSQTYTLMITRPLSDNARLDYVQFNEFEGGEDSPVVSYRVDSAQFVESETQPSVLEAEQRVRFETSRIILGPITEHPNATVRITKAGDVPEVVFTGRGNGAMLSDFINLDLGANEFTIETTAPNRVASSVYTLVVTREDSDNTELAALSVSGTMVTPVRGRYMVELPRDTMTFSVTAEAVHPQAMVMINDGAEEESSATLSDIPISLAMPEQTIRITVRAQNGVATTPYTLTVQLARNSDTRASVSLTGVSDGSPSSIRLVDNAEPYRADLAEETTSTLLVVDPVDASARGVGITENGNTIVPQSPQARVRIGIPETGSSRTLQIGVTAEDGTPQTYALTIVRARSSNACLDAIAILNSDGSALPSDTNRQIACDAINLNQSFNTSNSVAQIVVRPTAEDADNATIRVFAPGDTSGEEVQSGSNSSTIVVPEGSSATVTVVVTAQNGAERRYTVKVIREASSDANLRDLQLVDIIEDDRGENRLAFNPTLFTYTIRVPNSISSTELIATAVNNKARIRLDVDDERPTSATASIRSTLPLAAGVQRRIRIVVTAQDKTTTQGYTVLVRRDEPDSTNTDLANIRVETSLINPFRFVSIPTEQIRDGNTYRIFIDGTDDLEIQNINTFWLSLQPADPRATVRLGGERGVGGITNRGFTLRGPLDTEQDLIRNFGIIQVIAEDTNTPPATYRVIIIRRSSDDTRLASLNVEPSRDLVFDDDTNTYTASIRENTTATTVSVETRHSKATMEIILNEETDTTQNIANSRVPVANTGRSNTLRIKVIAQDRSTSQFYTVRVNRDGSSDNSLLRITVRDTDGVAEAVDIGNRSYTTTVTELVSEIFVTATAGSMVAREVAIIEDGSSTTSTREVSRPIATPDPGGSKNIEIRVTAQNGDVQSYTLTVHRERSSDARLQRLALVPSVGNSTITAVPIFTRATTVREHRRQFDFNVTGVQLRAAAHQNAAKVEVFAPSSSSTGEEIARGAASSIIPLTAGTMTEIRVVVTAPDQTTRNYVIRVGRSFNTDADLRDLELATANLRLNPGLGLDRAFDMDSNNLTYTVTGNVRTERLSVTVTSGPNQRITVDDDDENPIIESNADREVKTFFSRPLEYGLNTIRITVSAQHPDFSQTYRLRVFRQVVLEDLVLDGIKSDPRYVFDAFTRDYRVELSNQSTTLTVSPMIPDGSGIDYTISEGGNVIERNTAASIAIMTDETKVITIALQGANDTTYSYRVEATRDPSDIDDLGTFELFSGETFLFGLDDLTGDVYTESFSSPTDDDDIRLVAEVLDPFAMITEYTINNIAQEIGISSDKRSIDATITIGLRASRDIGIKVVAQDGMTSKTYVINLTRVISGDKELLTRPIVSGTTATEVGFRQYRIDLPSDTTRYSVRVTARHPAGIVSIIDDGRRISDGMRDLELPNIRISRGMPQEMFTIIVQAPDQTTAAHTLTVRLRAGADARLRSPLRVDGAEPLVLRDDLSEYTVTVPPGIVNTILTAVANDSFARSVTIGDAISMSINDRQTIAQPVTLRQTGSTQIVTIVVTAQNGMTRTYTITVMREESSDASLASPLRVDGAIRPLVLRDDLDEYTVTVLEDVMNTTVTAVANNPLAQSLTIGDARSMLVDGFQTIAQPVTLPQTGSTQTVTIVVTAQSGTMRTYTITVMRAGSSVATLESLNVARAMPRRDLMLQADPEVEYSATIPEDVMSTTVTATASDPRATVTINGMLKMEELVTIAETGSSQTLTIKVTAQNGTTSRTYTLRVARDESSDEDLAFLVIVEGDERRELLIPDDPERDEYSTTISEETAMVIAMARDPLAQSVTIGGIERTQQQVTLNQPGARQILTIEVTAQDGTTRNYIVTVVRASRTDNKLRGLQLLDNLNQPDPDLSLAPGFDENIFKYEVIGMIEPRITLEIEPGIGQIIRIGGDSFPDDQGNRTQGGDKIRVFRSLEYGDNTIEIRVEAENGVEQLYEVTVFRPVLLVDLVLVGLRDPYSFDDAFVTSYTVVIPNQTPRLEVTPTVPEPEGTTITYTISERAEGAEQSKRLIQSTEVSISQDIELDEGQTKLITIRLEAPNGTSNTYTVRATRELSRNADLGSLEILSGENSIRKFSNLTTGRIYMEDVDNPTTSIRLVAQTSNTNAMIIDFRVGVSTSTGVSMDKRSIDATIPLDEGEMTTITIKVLAQDNETSQTYMVRVTRLLSDDVRLDGPPIVLVSGSPVEVRLDGALRYTADVSSDSDSAEFSVQATARHPRATVTIKEGMRSTDQDGTTERSERLEGISITREMPQRDITITVQADRGNTENYTLTVTLTESSDATLGRLTVERAIPELSDLALAPNKDTYTATIPEGVMNTTVTAVANNRFAQSVLIGVARSMLIDGFQTIERPVFLPQTGSSQTLTIRVTAQNGMPTTYTLTVMRARSSNNKLGGLVSLDGRARFDQVFDEDDFEYEVILSNENDDVSEILLQITPGFGQRITLGNVVLSDHNNNVPIQRPIPLQYGENAIEINVLPQNRNRERIQTYTLNVFRPVALSGLGLAVTNVEGVSSDVSFTFRRLMTDYVVVPFANQNSILTVTPMAGSGIEYTIFDRADSEGALDIERSQNMPASISFEEGQRRFITIELKAPAPNETTNTYTVTATREASSDVMLQAPPTVGSVASVPDDPDNPRTYTVTIPEGPEGVLNTTVIAVANSKFARAVTIMEVGGDETAMGVRDADGRITATGRVTLEDTGDSKTLRITVTAQNNAMRTYDLVVTRAESADATASLRVEGGDPSQLVLDDDENPYSVTIDEDMMITTVTAVANNEFAQAVTIMEVGGDELGRGVQGADERITANGRVTLDQTGASKTLRITVTAQNGMSRIYELTVMRDESSVDDLERAERGAW